MVLSNALDKIALHQKIKIGVMGSSSLKGVTKKQIEAVREVGREIARHNCILITGATTGLPLEAARGAKEEGGLVIGISPATCKERHIKLFKLVLDYHDVIIYSGFGFKGRNVVNIRTSDALVFVRGSTGTLNEFTIAFDDGKIIGVLRGTGGMADHMKHVRKICTRDMGAYVTEGKNPRTIVEKLLKRVEHEFPRPVKTDGKKKK